MSEKVELTSFDLRYQDHRLRSDAREARLLASIAERGIERPLEGVDAGSSRFLLNGFKRYRCAKKLGIFSVPYVSLGADEATGIVSLMRASAVQPLDILEQARFVAELLDVHQLSAADVAETLGRSKGWVSMRRSLLESMTPEIQRILFRGSFPVYSYTYTLRPFRRMNSVGPEQIERFMKAVAGKGLSVRDIELLAHGYFRGPGSLRQALDEGKIGWSLDQMKNVPEDREGCSAAERAVLKDLEIVQKYLRQVMTKCEDPRLASRAFFAQANLLAGWLLSEWPTFHERMKRFYDRTGQA